MTAAADRRKLREQKQHALAQRQAEDKRRQIHAALRAGKFDHSTNTYTVRYLGTELTLSEYHYLWLYVRQELNMACCPTLPPRVNDQPYLELKESE